MALFRTVTPQYIYRNLLKAVANTIEKNDHQKINIEVYLVRIRENTDQKKFRIGTLFT